MGIFRNLLLWGSENQWMRNNVPNYGFVKSAVKRFMPGERVEDAILVTKEFNSIGIPTTFTYLGENLSQLSEARTVTDHYLQVLDLIKEENIQTEISVKLTQLGFDLSQEKTLELFEEILNKANGLGITVFIDMEGSNYTQATIEFYKKVKKKFNNVGLCLQSYLYRTEKDILDLLEFNPVIRLVKGAYNESPDKAFPKKSDNDDNYLKLSKILLDNVKEGNVRAAFATHDEVLGRMIIDYGDSIGLSKDRIEFQMLYGIKSTYQRKLEQEGVNLIVLISYGDAWFPWYMRRLAERPANVGFVLKSMFTN